MSIHIHETSRRIAVFISSDNWHAGAQFFIMFLHYCSVSDFIIITDYNFKVGNKVVESNLRNI